MKFQKGAAKPANSGRKKGTPNKRKLVRVAELLAEKEINPAEEILALIPHLEEKDQISAWLDLLSYCQAKPKAAENDDDEPEDDSLESVTNADLLRLVKKPSSGPV